jgi:hypothetical protein
MANLGTNGTGGTISVTSSPVSYAIKGAGTWIASAKQNNSEGVNFYCDNIQVGSADSGVIEAGQQLPFRTRGDANITVSGTSGGTTLYVLKVVSG